jgi:hypothetical protein
MPRKARRSDRLANEHPVPTTTIEKQAGNTPVSVDVDRGEVRTPVATSVECPTRGQPESDGQEDAAELKTRRIGQVFAEIMSHLPTSERRKLPQDGSEQHDHYIYGWPKREQ